MASIPIPVSVQCDVADVQPDITVSWKDSDAAANQPVLVGVFRQDAVVPLFSASFASAPGLNTVSVHVEVPLVPTRIYEIRVARESPSPTWSNGVPLLFLALEDLTVAASDAGILARWTNRSTTVTAGQLVLTGDAGAPAILAAQASASDWSLFPLAVPLALPPPVRLQVRPVGGGLMPDLTTATSLGPPTAEATLLLTAPSASLIDNSGANPRTVRVARPDGTAALRTFVVELLADGAVVQTITATEEASPDPVLQLDFSEPLPASKLHTLTLRQQEGSVTGPPGPPAPILVAAPIPRTLARHDASVDFDVALGGLPLPLAVSVAGGANPPVIVEGSSGSVATPAADLTFRAALPLANGLSLGPAVTARPGPSIAQATTDPVSGTTTLVWTAVSGAASYLVQLYGGDGLPSGAPLPAATTMLTLPQPLPPNAPALAAVSVVTAGGTDPIGIRFPLPVQQPSHVSVDFDGTTVRAAWTPAAGATGYRISVLGSTAAPALTATVGNVSSAALSASSLSAGTSYRVVVQALAGENSGPPTAPLPLFTPGYFIGTPASIRPATTMALAPETITVLLPQISTRSTAFVPVGGDGPFRLESNNSTALPFRLVIPADSIAWTFTSAPIRDALQTAYRELLVAAEGAGITQWGIGVLQQAISRVMPQTFVETLYYAYGLSLALQAPSGAGYADLRPGMVLRVASAGFLDPAVTPPPAHLAGFMPGGFVDYDVASLMTGPGTPWTASFDAFLGQLAANGIVAVEPPPGSGANEGGMADAADLLFPELRQPFYRLFFPATLQSPSSPGSSLTAQSFAIAAASTYELLQLTGNTPVPGSPVAYFRGRAVVRLCIRVFINGVEQIVPIGTTVGNLLERYAAQAPSAALRLGGLTMKRSRGLVVVDPESAGAGASYPVRFDWKTLAVYGAAYDALSLPLLHGDQVTFGR